VEEHVKGIKSSLTSIISGDERSEAEEERANDGTPETLKTDDKNRVEDDGLQKEFFDDDLRSLDNLSDNDKSATKGDLGSAVFLSRRGGGIGDGRGADELWSVGLHKSGKSDDNKSESDKTDTSPVRSMKLALKEDL